MSYFAFKNHNIYYDLQGIGKPILILNGIMMSTKSWEPFLNSFTASNSLLRVDFIDQGASDKAKIEYTQDTQADLLSALLDYLKISKINVVGISYGGEVALHFAIKYKQKVDRLLLFNTTAKTSDWLKDIGEGWIITAKTRDPRAYYFQTIPVIYSPHFYHSRIDWMKNREKVLAPVFSNPVFLDAMERLTRSAETHDVRDSLQYIEAPTLIVTADEDYLTPMPEQKYLHQNIKHSFLVQLPQVGHASMYEVPFVFASLVLGFINNPDVTYAI
ncbi:MAG: alpha/beta hydrolase [Acholeplasmatales bacterium]|jgi:pimeloyl-ACP methyl ester carboxylesterase|nr:alpha/beta hydrolase [Acholeplasmatales bacterium]